MTRRSAGATSRFVVSGRSVRALASNHVPLRLAHPVAQSQLGV